MYLRVDNELADRLHSASERYALPIAEIVRRALRWSARKGKCVVIRKTRKVTTYKGEMLKLTDVPPELIGPKTPAQIRAVLRQYLDVHDPAPGEFHPGFETHLIAGIDYNVPASEVFHRWMSKRERKQRVRR